MILGLIADALVGGQSVVLRNVGTLETYVKTAQRYRHPATGEVRVASPKRHIRLILSQGIRKRLRRRSR